MAGACNALSYKILRHGDDEFGPSAFRSIHFGRDSVGRNTWAEMNGPKLSGPKCTGPKFSGTYVITYQYVSYILVCIVFTMQLIMDRTIKVLLKCFCTKGAGLAVKKLMDQNLKKNSFIFQLNSVSIVCLRLFINYHDIDTSIQYNIQLI